jgi:hypothetical protein
VELHCRQLHMAAGWPADQQAVNVPVFPSINQFTPNMATHAPMNTCC